MNIYISKRRKIIISAVIVTIGLLSTQLVNFNLRFNFMAALGVLAYGLSLWSLWEGILEPEKPILSFNRVKAVILMVLPVFFTVAVASFYFLLPVRWLTRIPVAVIFGLMFYLLLLAQNVFNVASIRTIPLFRAASTASFLFTLLAAFFLYNVIYAFNLLFVWNALAVFLVSFPLILQVIWSLEMEDRVSVGVLTQSFILSLILGEIALAFSFWPTPTTIWSLALASSMYVLVGLTTQVLRGKTAKRVVWEYLGIGTGILLISFFITSWTG